MISHFFDTLFTITRQVWSGESSSEQTQGTFYGHLQQASASLTISLAQSITKPHLIWCPLNTDVHEGDRLALAGVGYFTVKNIFKYDIGINQHLELFVEKETSYASV